MFTRLALTCALLASGGVIWWQGKELDYDRTVIAAIQSYSKIVHAENTKKMAVLKKQNGEIDAILARTKKRMSGAGKDWANRRDALVNGLHVLQSGDSASPTPTICSGTVAFDEADAGCTHRDRVSPSP